MRAIRITLLIVFLVAWAACGGGSVGTGTRTLSGRISFEGDRAAAGLRVDLADGSATTNTDGEGVFSLPVPEDAAQVGLTVVSDQQTSELQVPIATDDAAAQLVAITLSSENKVQTFTNLDMLAKFTGVCQKYFDNSRTIEQLGPVPSGTRCPVLITALENGAPVAVPFEIQYRACDEGSEWKTLNEGITSNSTGKAEVNVRYVSSADKCVYRIVAPAPFKNGTSVVHEVKTLAAQ